MKKIIIFQPIGKDRRFETKFTDVNLTPLNEGDSIDFPSKMSSTGWVRFLPQSKNVTLDTRSGEWVETTTLTGVFMIVQKD